MLTVSDQPKGSLPALLYLHLHPAWAEYQDTKEFCLPSGIMMPRRYNCSHVYWCLWPVYSGLKYYVDAVRSARKPKSYVPIVERSAFDPVDGAHEDAWRTVKLAEKFRHVTVRHSETVSMDEITRGMAHVFKTRTVPIWVTFGMQILLDIQDILGPSHVGAPFQELHDFLDKESATTEAFKKSWSLPFNMGTIVSGQQEYLKDALEAAKAIADDSCDTLKHNPVRCGLLRYGT